MAPSTQQQWRVQGKGNGTFDNLNFNKEAPIPEVGAVSYTHLTLPTKRIV